MGLEPINSVWKTKILPLNYIHIRIEYICISIDKHEVLEHFYHQPLLTLISSQHLMVILGEFSYYDNFNDNSMINLTHRKGLLKIPVSTHH
jgi:hypothetical protein